MSAYTPGPWFVRKFNGRNYVMDATPDVQGKVVARTIAHPPVSDEDAALISAAPELLDALDYLLAQTVDMDLKHGIGLSEGEEEAMAKALAAIAKANGGAR